MKTILLVLALALPQSQTPITGYTAIHLESGKRVSARGAEAFPMGSVYKFPIAVAALRRVDAGKLPLTKEVTVTKFSPGWSPLREASKGRPVTITVQVLIELMLRDSDNTACDVLIGMLGGGPAITKELGLRGIRIDRTETAISADIKKSGAAAYTADPRDTATPDAMADFLVRFWRGQLGLSKKSHDMAVQMMTDTKTGANRMITAIPKGASLAHKTGTMPGTVNDVGIITIGNQHYAVAVFTKGGSEASFKAQEKTVADTARTAISKLK